MFRLNVFRGLLPSTAHFTGEGGLSFSASSSLTALSLALRLVVARGLPGQQQQLASSWMSAAGSCANSRAFCTRLGATRHGGQPTIALRDPRRTRCWLFGGGGNGSVGGKCTDLGTRCRTLSCACRAGTWSRRAALAGLVGSCSTGVLGATIPAASSCSTSTATGADPGAASDVGGAGDNANVDVDADGDRDGPGAPSALTRGSLRTNRDRGGIKRETETSKSSKASPSLSPSLSSSYSSAAGVGGSSGSDSRGGSKLLRLSKLLADRAVGSRSEVDVLVRRGRVKVDGTVVKSPKMKLPVDCVIEVDGQECGPVPLLVAFHKPKGVITTLSDDWDREDLSDVLPKSLLRRHHPVGRLDADSSGLLLLSSDGALTHRLLNPRFEVEREYVATVDVSDPASGEPGDVLVATLREGVPTADGVYKADVAGIDGRDVRVVVREGKNRMVRRMLANAGYPVLELKRERYGNILLGDLPEGEHAPVSGEALEWASSVFQLQPALVGNGGDEGKGAGL